MKSFIGKIKSITHYTKCPKCDSVWVYIKYKESPSMSCKNCGTIFSKEMRYIGSYIEYDDSDDVVAEILADHLS